MWTKITPKQTKEERERAIEKIQRQFSRSNIVLLGYKRWKHENEKRIESNFRQIVLVDNGTAIKSMALSFHRQGIQFSTFFIYFDI